MAINPSTGLEDPNYTPIAANDKQVNGGPAINLDVMNQYRSALNAGPALEHTATPQAPVGSVSNVSGGLSNLQVAPPIASPIISGKVTPTGMQTTEGAPQGGEVIPTSPLEGAQQGVVDALKKQQEEKDAIDKAKEEARILAEKAHGQDVLDEQAYVKQNAQTEKEMNDITTNKQIQDAQDSSMALKQNVSYLAGAIGQPMSVVGLQGQQQQIKRSQELVSQIQSLKGLQDKKYDAAIAKQMADLQKDLDTTVGQAVQNSMNIAMKLNASGQLDSPGAILKAKQDMMRTIVDTYNNKTLQNTELAKFYLDTVEKSIEQDTKRQETLAKSQEFSKEITAASGGEYLLTVTGSVMKDANGIPMKKMVGKEIEQVITDNKGDVTILYKDGTFSEPKKAIGKAEVEKPIFQKVTGGVQQMVIDPETGYYVPVGEVISQEETMTPYQKAQIEIEKSKLAQTGGVSTTGEKRYIVTKDGLYDTQTESYIDPSSKTSSGVSTEDIATKTSFVEDGIKGGQCGAFVNKQLGTPNFFGNSIDQKAAKINSNVPSIGSAIIMDSAKYPKDGHVGIVIGVEGDNVIVKDSNWRGDEKVTEHNFNVNDPAIRGYYVPTTAGISTTSPEIKAVAKELIDGKTKVSDLKPLGYTQNEIRSIQDEKIKMESEKGGELSPDEQVLVKSLQEYNLDPSKLPGGMSKEAQASKKRILAAAFNDPNYDMKKYPAQQALYKSWTSGPMANNNNGITTVTRHMMELKPALEALQNKDFKKFNQLWNAGSTQFGVADTNDAAVIADAVGSEMAKVYKGNASPTQDEIKEWSSKINTALSGGQQAGLLKTLSKLMYGKITSNAQNYTRTMGEKPVSIFDIESQEFLRQNGVNVGKDFKVSDLHKPSPAEITSATPKVVADIKAGKTLAEMKQHAIDIGTDPAFVEQIYNANKSQTAPTGTPVQFKSKSGKTYSF